MQGTFVSGSPKCSQYIMVWVVVHHSENFCSDPLIARVAVIVSDSLSGNEAHGACEQVPLQIMSVVFARLSPESFPYIHSFHDSQ